MKFTGSIHENHEKAIEQATSSAEFTAWVDGEKYEAKSGETFTTRDPAVDRPITEVPRCGKEDIDAAVEAARDAFENEWSDTTPEERSNAILEWVDVMRENIDELALLESLDTGKPLAYAKDEMGNAFEFFEYSAMVARSNQGEHIDAGSDTHIYVRKEPYGVVGQILPWNYPMLLAGWKLAPALAAGNTVVFKPSEEAPLSLSRICQLSKDIFPDGVVNVVHGYGEEAGAPLTEHSGVDKVSFTGSVETGQTVMRAASQHITPVTLELGGKSPFVVFEDADLESAVESSATGIFYNSGQSCDACSRVLVHEDVHDEFLEMYVNEAESHVLGDPLSEGTTMGPLSFEDQYEKVNRYVELGQKEGAELVTGGGHPSDNELQEGWFFEPTVFDDVDNSMRIAQEEIFGPVQCIITFSDYDEAIELANDVKYGLASGVATEDPSKAHRAAADIEAGSVWINHYFGTIPGTPFGGYKYSGIGRECARETLDEYTQSKAVNMSL